MSAPASLGYLVALLRAAPLGDVARTAFRRAVDPPRWHRPAPAPAADAARAAASLGLRPTLFPVDDVAMRALYLEALPGAAGRAITDADRILAGEVLLFGRWQLPGGGPHRPWQLDVRTGRRFDGAVPADELDLLQPGADPRGAWELARGHHLLELGVAARLAPDLGARARAFVRDEILSFLDENPPGFGVHWTSPLEAALRAVHWLAALELTRADRDADTPPAFLRRLGGALVEHGRFLAANLEDRGVVAANHLIGDLLGLLAIGVALGDAAEAPAWRARAASALAVEANKQVLPDGAAFEASTAYHRFTLELLLAADRIARAAAIDLPLAPTLARMFRFVAGYLGPDGGEPAFGDGDDGRVLPAVARAPRDHAYLLPLGVVHGGDPSLRLAGVPFSEEAAWLDGPAGWRRFRALAEVPRLPVASFPDGGVHVLRGGGARDVAGEVAGAGAGPVDPTRGDQVVFRCGGYGQHGVGGHAHNDQLSIAVWLDGAPLVIDPGTFCYAADPTWRNHLRGTAAHATVIVDGAEQSPLFEGRMFALPDGAHAERGGLDDVGAAARVVGRHGGYRRLPSRLSHEREVLLDRRARAVVVTDRLSGVGSAAVEARFPLADEDVRPGESVLSVLDAPWLRARLDGAPWAADLDVARGAVVFRDGRPFAGLFPLAARSSSGTPAATPRATIAEAWWSPRYGERRRGVVVSFSGRMYFPCVESVAILLLGPDLPAR